MGFTTHTQADEYGGMWYRGDSINLLVYCLQTFINLYICAYPYVNIQIYILAKCYVVDFKYQYEKAKIINTEPHSLGKTVVANQCSKVIYSINAISKIYHTPYIMCVHVFVYMYSIYFSQMQSDVLIKKRCCLFGFWQLLLTHGTNNLEQLLM